MTTTVMNGECAVTSDECAVCGEPTDETTAPLCPTCVTEVLEAQADLDGCPCEVCRSQDKERER